MTSPPLHLDPGLRPGGRYDDWRRRRPAYVVCDVDGTLVGPADLASPEVVAAVERAQAAGVRVGLATGRMRLAVESLWRQLRARGPHVLHNGAEIRADGVTIASWQLTPEQVDGLLAVARSRRDCYVEIYTDMAYYVSSWDERARPHWGILGGPPTGLIRQATDLDGAVPLKATFAVFDPGATDELEAAVAALGALPGSAGSPRTPHLTYVNVTHPDADKGRALMRAARHLDVSLEQTVAIGDATNDLSMLAVAGTAIAMGQAPAVVRDAAHLVVPAVDVHGVAVALEALTAWANDPER